MKNRIILYSLLLACTGSINAQDGLTNEQAQHAIQKDDSFWNEKMLEIAKPESKEGWIKFKETTNITEEQFFEISEEILGLEQNIKLEFNSEKTDHLGGKHSKYQQFYKGIEVIGSQLILHTKNAKVASVNGSIIEVIDLSDEPELSKSETFKSALKYSNSPKNLPFEEIDGELKWLPLYEEGDVVLCYQFSLKSYPDMTPKYYYINASTGALEGTTDLVRFCDNGSGNTLYNGNQAITTHKYWNFPSIWELQDNCRNIETQRNKNYSGSPNAWIRIKDGNNYFSANNDRAGASAHWAAEKTYDYYNIFHQRSSYDGNGGKIDLIVESNASPGAFDKAYWNSVDNNFHFGEGSYGDALNDLVSVDVVAHELTHSYTNRMCSLNGFGESGAIDEAISDIFGVLVEYYATGGAGNYSIAEDCWNNGGWRNLQNPNSKSNPDTYQGNFWSSSLIHNNSTVFGHWFYLLAEGGSGTNDNSTVFNLVGLGRADAADILFRAINIYFTSSTDFADARDATIWAAEDLFGDCSNQVVQVIEAWNAVGVTSNAALNSPDPNFTAPASVCEGTSFTVSPTVSTGVSHKWWFYPLGGSKGSPNTSSTPIFTANTSGNYQVEHEITTSCGVFTMTQNVIINSTPNVNVDRDYFCETTTVGNLIYNPIGGTMTGNGVVWYNGAWKFNANQVGPGDHQITYSYTNGGCTGTDVATITVENYNSAQIINTNQFYCESDNDVILAGNPSGGTWTGNGISFSNGTWVFDPTGNTGANIIEYTVESQFGYCSSTDQITFYVDDPITFAPSIPFPDACLGANECFSANPSNLYSRTPSFSWNFTGAATPSTSNYPNQCVQFNSTGNIGVTLIGTNACGTTTLPLSVEVVAPETNFAITTTDIICGQKTLQTNYSGSTWVSWDGPGVNSSNGVLNNPSTDVTTRTITATIEDACQVTHTKTFTQYKKKDILPNQFCTYDPITQLVADIAPGTWSISPSNPALNQTTGEFDPSISNSGVFSVTHQSVCNKTNDIVVLEGGPEVSSHWPKHILDVNEGDEIGEDVISGNDGVYYITGTFTNEIQLEQGQTNLVSTGGTDIYIAKYDECGIVWSKSFGGNGNDTRPSLAIDHINNVEYLFLSATIEDNISNLGSCNTCNLIPASSEKGMVAKFDANGNAIWANIPANEPSEMNIFNDIDAFGQNVIVTGSFIDMITLSSNNSSENASGGAADQDILAIEIIDLGSTVGTMKLATIGSHNFDAGNAISMDYGSQETWITGYATSIGMSDVAHLPQNSGGKDIFVGRLDNGFNWTWTALYGGSNDDEGLGIDADNHAAVTGYTKGDVEFGTGIIDQTTNLSQDLFVLTLQPDGLTDWYQLGGSDFDIDQGTDITISESTTIAVIGEFSDNAQYGGFSTSVQSFNNSDRDIVVLSYNLSGGNGIGITSIYGESSIDHGNAITYNSDNQDFYITGDFDGEIDITGPLAATYSIDMFAARYSVIQGNLFYKKKEEYIDLNLNLNEDTYFKVFPNPFYNSVSIKSNQLLKSTIKAIDVTGKLIFQIEDIEPGSFNQEIDLSQYSKGIYFIKLFTNENVKTVKLIKQ